MGMNAGNLKEAKWNWATVPPDLMFISGCRIVSPPSPNGAQMRSEQFGFGSMSEQ